MAKELKIRITGDASGLKKGTDEAQGILSGFGSKISAWSVASGQLIADGIKTGVKGVGALIGSSISEASDLNESMTKVQQIFKDSTSTVVTFAEGAATTLGQSKLSALDAAATFGQFGKVAGLTGDDLATFAEQNVAMASDFASFFNTSPEEAIEKIGAAFRGESEPIRSFGIMLDAASLKSKAFSMGLVKGEVDALKLSKANEAVAKSANKYAAALEKHGQGSIEADEAAVDLNQAQMALAATMEGSVPDLTAGQKILAAQALIMEQGSDAAGDFGETSAGLANQQRILAAQFSNLKGAIGQAFLPIVLDLVQALNSKVVPLFQKWAPILAEDIAGAIRSVVTWGQKLVALFQSGGWQAVAGEVLSKLKDMFIAFEIWAWTVAYPAIGRFLLALAKQFGAWVKDTAVPYLIANLPGWLDAFGNWFMTTAVPFMQAQGEVLSRLLSDWITAASSYLAENLPGWLATFGEWFATTALPWLGERVGEIALKMGDWVELAAGHLRDNLPRWLGAFTEWVVGTAIPAILVATAKFALEMAEWVAEAAAGLARRLPGYLAEFTGWVVSSALPAILRFGIDAVAAMARGFMGMGDVLYDVGVAIVQGLISGIWSMAGTLSSSVSSFVNANIPGPVRSLLGINSPSRVFYKIGVQTAQGLAGGLDAGGAYVAAAAGRMATQAFVSPSYGAGNYASAGAAGGGQGGYQQAQMLAVVQIDGRTLVTATARPAQTMERARR